MKCAVFPLAYFLSVLVTASDTLVNFLDYPAFNKHFAAFQQNLESLRIFKHSLTLSTC